MFRHFENLVPLTEKLCVSAATHEKTTVEGVKRWIYKGVSPCWQNGIATGTSGPNGTTPLRPRMAAPQLTVNVIVGVLVMAFLLDGRERMVLDTGKYVDQWLSRQKSPSLFQHESARTDDGNPLGISVGPRNDMCTERSYRRLETVIATTIKPCTGSSLEDGKVTKCGKSSSV